MLRLACFIIFCSSTIAKASEDLPQSCESPIYCYGDILHQVQLSRLYDDSKTFVDLKMQYSQTETLQNFEALQKSTGNNPSKEDLRTFVNYNFEDGNELIEWTIPDFKVNPDFIQDIANNTIKKFAEDIIRIWPSLGRNVKQDVFDNPDQYSLIPVPNGFIVPGGRFQEYYYWDSYWIIDGLLVNEMTETARGMIENFLSLVKQLGFIPNGGRIYYLRRSQPPLLTPMAHLYYSATKDSEWVIQHIDQLETELNYWEGQRVDVYKNCKVYRLYHYNAVSSGPRPESYREDYETAGFFKNESKRREVYIDLKSGAESGWDFSNRWVFDEQGDNKGNLSYIETRRVVPVDLNAFLCLAFKQISELFAIIGQLDKSASWEKKYIKIKNSITGVLWNSEDGVWYDYDIKLNKHRRSFYPTNLTPLWAKCVDSDKAEIYGKSALKYLMRTGALAYQGGIPSSLDNTGEQWDFPNAWAALQDIVVRGLQNSNHEPAQQQARELAERWINANYIGFTETNEMFEKYDAVETGKYGGGGEYKVQPGFGFTNGVALRFIYDYYTTL